MRAFFVAQKSPARTQSPAALCVLRLEEAEEAKTSLPSGGEVQMWGRDE